MTTLLWFRRDLRLTDNPAFNYAVESGAVLPVYIHYPEEEAPWQPGAASNWWLHHSLTALKNALAERGLPLLIQSGPSLETLQHLIEQTGATQVVWNRLYEPAVIARDSVIKQTLAEQVTVKSFNANLLLEPWQIQNKQGRPFKVFTPYWKTCQNLLAQAPPTPSSVTTKPIAAKATQGLTIDELTLLPTLNWADDFSKYWQPGEEGAKDRLAHHLQHNLGDYKTDRDFPALPATSKLSAHLHFGEIGPRQIWATIEHLAPTNDENELVSRQHFLSEIAWREFAHHLLYHFPETVTQPFNSKWQNFEWNMAQTGQAAKWLSAWKQGTTGTSLVDAGMQELWQTGWMHNRVRMLVGSLLTKNMGIHWQQGARWFWDT
ncbi:MAG: deoxyribodipyrimidine photo-lyase, partial [Gammaproteobacteria bacterium]|nr:deoxyribodipyrimidine photo-lyase [Gammaproteobacteria bacterium]